jgi:hypothetical protein
MSGTVIVLGMVSQNILDNGSLSHTFESTEIYHVMYWEYNKR